MSSHVYIFIFVFLILTVWFYIPSIVFSQYLVLLINNT